MTTFYPGPSKIYPSVGQYLQDAFDSGILQMNHRSEAFMDMLRECIKVFKEKQNIPTDYQVYFTSSATECWEIVSQSLTQQGSLHFFNGAFGKKWYEYSSKILSSKFRATVATVPSSKRPSLRFQDKKIPLVREEKPEPKGAGGCKSFKFSIEEELNFENISDDFDVLCFTQNETSNGTAINLNTIFTHSLIHSFTHSNSLIAFDVTSSLGGVELDWTLGDVWLASVQKCLGLPAGMGVMIVSPKALKQAKNFGDRNYYNSLLFIQENFEKYQTHYTPNILTIYLLLRVMNEVENISVISQRIKKQAEEWYDFIENETKLELLIKNTAVRSETVIAVSGLEDDIKTIKKKALAENIVLGNGYGDWKNTTFRIANFPAITSTEIQTLKTLLKHGI